MWFITTLERLHLGKNGFVDFGDKRTLVFYDTEEMAIKSLNNNNCDMWEDMYDYAVLEHLRPNAMYGLWEDDEYEKSRKWFAYDANNDGYFEIKEPEFVKHLIHIGIG
jgi:hypothetical protein